MREFFTKVKDFAITAAYGLGTIGGVGFCISGHSWPCAIGVAVLAVLAFPEVRKTFKDLIS